MEWKAVDFEETPMSIPPRSRRLQLLQANAPRAAPPDDGLAAAVDGPLQTSPTTSPVPWVVRLMDPKSTSTTSLPSGWTVKRLFNVSSVAATAAKVVKASRNNVSCMVIFVSVCDFFVPFNSPLDLQITRSAVLP